MGQYGATIQFTRSFLDAYNKLPQLIKRKLDRQLQILTQNINHPSLRARKMTGMGNIWEARVDIHYRITFDRIDGIIRLRLVGNHDIYLNP